MITKSIIEMSWGDVATALSEYGTIWKKQYLENTKRQTENVSFLKGEADMGNRHRKRVYLGTDEHKRPLYKWVSGNSARELELAVGEVLGKAGLLSISKKEEGVLFKDYALEWWEIDKKPHLRPNSIENYAMVLSAHILPAFGEMHLGDITRQTIQNYYNEKRHLAKETVKKHRNILNMILSCAEEDGHIEKNPMNSKKLRITSTKETKKEALENEVVRELFGRISELTREEDRQYFALLALTGLRKGEVLGLKWEDIDYDKMEINVSRAITHPKRNHPQIEQPKTSAGVRTIPLSDTLITYLGEHQGSGFLFHMQKSGEPMPYASTIRMWQRIQKTLGIDKKVGCHCLRHTFLSELYANSRDAKTVQTIAGHADISTTMNRYVHSRKEYVQKARRHINALYQ